MAFHSAYRVKYLCFHPGWDVIGSVCCFGFRKKGPRAVYGPKGVRERKSSWNFSVRRLVHRLALWQRANKECADLRSARHLAGMYSHNMNARDYSALFYQIYRTTYSKINDH